jgi:hypothetical protein
MCGDTFLTVLRALDEANREIFFAPWVLEKQTFL